MAPTPGDDDGGRKQYQNEYIPSVTTATYTPNPQTTVTVAYLINSYIDAYGHPQTYTISAFPNLAVASQAAEHLEEAKESYDAGTFPTDPAAISSLYSGYGTATATSAQAENQYSSSPMSGPIASATGSTNPVAQQESQNHHHGPSVGVIAAGIIVPILVCLATITVCIFCVSHYRRKARRTQAANMAERTSSSEMSEVGRAKPSGAGVPDERAYLAPPNEPVPASTPLSAIPLAAGANRQEPPVILSTTMNNTYYTGIDTSDHISLSDQRSMASHDTFGEEPPPPYRPRSVPPISRETSVRTSIISTPNRNSSIRSRCETLSGGSIIRRSNEVRSPFDDPEEEEEDDISDTSTIRESSSRRDADRLSVVSDLSYQDEPASSHSHV